MQLDWCAMQADTPEAEPMHADVKVLALVTTREMGK